MVLDLKEEITSFLVLWQLLLEEKQLGVCQVDEEPQGDVKQLPVVAVISEDWEKVTFDDCEVPEGSPNFMVVVIPPQEADQILDTLDTVRIRMIHIISVGVLYIHAETGAGCLNTIRYKCRELQRGISMVPEVLLLPNHPSLEEKITANIQLIRSKHSLFLKLYFPIKQEYWYLNAI